MSSVTMSNVSAPPRPSAIAVLKEHWPLYLIEAALLGSFMVSACAFTALLEHPASVLTRGIPSALVRRSIIGIAMGVTAIALIYSRWGKRSGAHMNPAVTLCFLRMGKIEPSDAIGYAAAQFIGGTAGVLLSATLAAEFIRHPVVQCVVTLPGAYGVGAAWAAEFLISALLMAVVLGVNRVPKLARLGGYFAGILVTLYITVEGPISGMSMNPARSFGSAAVAHLWRELWIYFTAPPIGMLAAVELHRFWARHPHALCPRLNHCPHTSSIFRCNCHDPDRIERSTEPVLSETVPCHPPTTTT
jgi:aquaporin Z